MRSLQIIENTQRQLEAVQTAYSSSWLLGLAIIVAAGFSIWLIRARQWKLLIIPAAALFVFGLLALMPKAPTYHLVVNLDDGQIRSEAKRGDRVVSSFVVSTHELSGADMQFNRGATTIVLIRKDGSLLFPLGEQQLQNEPDQYVVLNVLRTAIGNTASNK